MSLIVETGENIAGAESYATVAFCDTYFSNRGNTTWIAFTTAQKESYLRISTDFMLQRYKLYWKGFQKFASQSLDWPRTFVQTVPVLYGDNSLPYPQLISSTIVPIEVQKACAELALKASTYTDGLLPDVEDMITEETIGPITTKYDKRSPVSRIYKNVDAMLSPYLKDGGMGAISVTSQRA